MEVLLKNLNPLQQEAVKHTEGPLLILAGAGSGKTRVLTHRIAYLLKTKGVPPGNILAVTFTNKAAEEMGNRLQLLVGAGSAFLWLGTFHAVCVRILRREIKALGYQSSFLIYDPGDQLILLRQVLRELNLDEQRYPLPVLRAQISKAKNSLFLPENYRQSAATPFEEKVAAVYTLYQKKLFANNALDFDDLILQTVVLFERYPQVLAFYQERFRYLLIDEYQDTNRIQYFLVKLLAARHRNLCVVGDPDQSIYRWRGADLSNILNFEADYPEARVIVLTENYRSTPNILAAANAVIRHNQFRKEKELWSKNELGPPLVVLQAEDEHAEARYVAGEILWEHIQAGRAYGEFAVFYRTHAQSRVLEEVFLQKGIPYEVVGGLKFYERKEIKDLLAYLRLVVAPEDSLSLERIINVPRRGVGKVTWQKMVAYAGELGLPAALVLTRAREIPGIAASARGALEKLGLLLDRLRREKERLTVTEILEEVLEGTGYQAVLEKEKTVESEARLENIAELFSLTREYDAKEGEKSLADFLTQVALVAEADAYTGNEERVALMTLHTAKGLEFPVVFLTGLEEGIFPHARAFTTPEELEEERRLCYVGMTRAQFKLYLTYATRRMLYGRAERNKPSRFLKEIPTSLKEFKTSTTPVLA